MVDLKRVFVFLLPLAMLACNDGVNLCSDYTGTGNCVGVSVDKNDPTTSLKEAFLSLQDGDELRLPEGEFMLTGELTITNKSNITIRGAGKTKTRLDFSDSAAGGGAAGIKTENMDGITVEDLAVLNTQGDGIVLLESENVIVRNVLVEWENGPDTGNGLYGLYPLRSSNVLVEYTDVRGASDAGIYIGESNNVIARYNNAWENVNGIQIENTVNSEVYENTATNNTLGIFVFDLPNKLSNKNGGGHLVYNNTAIDNNEPNFSDPSQIAGDAPVGTGILVMATKDVEIYGNTIDGNAGLGIAVLSYYATLRDISDPEYFPYPMSVYVHDNVITNGGFEPAILNARSELQDTSLAISILFSDEIPDMAFDGVTLTTAVETGNAENHNDICFKDNDGAGSAKATLGNMNLAALGVTDPELGFDDFIDKIDDELVDFYEDDDNPFGCEGKEQPGVSLPFAEE